MNTNLCCIILILILICYISQPTNTIYKFNPRCVNLFWTGGYDSTFRLLQIIIIEKKCVNPIYLNFNSLDGSGFRRQNVRFELETMYMIINELYRLGYGGQIMPLTIITEVKLSSTVIRSCSMLFNKGYLRRPVSQYAHMVQLSLDLNKIVEECAEKSEHSTSYKMLNGKLNDDKMLCLDKAVGTPLYVIRNIRFPIIDLTKKDMLKIAKKHNFAYILKWTKSCWWPYSDGTPCRKCLMCRTRKEELPEELQESFVNEGSYPKFSNDNGFNSINPRPESVGCYFEKKIGNRFSSPMKTPLSTELQEILYNNNTYGIL
jgi:hypothetical protein